MKKLGVEITLCFLSGIALYRWAFPFLSYAYKSWWLYLGGCLCLLLMWLLNKLKPNRKLFLSVCYIGFCFMGMQRMAVCSQTPSRLEDYLEAKSHIARNAVQKRLEAKLYDKKHKAVAAALLLGKKDGLDRKTREAFRKAGISHTLALSGMHVGIIWGIVCALLYFFRYNYRTRRIGTCLSSVIIIIYAFLTGLSPSVSRACIMLVVWKAGENMAGSKDRTNALAFAALLICIFNPWALYMTGFQLSFAAIMGITLIYPAIEESIIKVSGKKRTNNVLKRAAVATAKAAGVSLSCQIATFPLILLYFGKISGNFLLSNILSAPLVALSVYGSAAAAVFGDTPYLGTMAGKFLSFAISVLLKTVMFLGT